MLGQRAEHLATKYQPLQGNDHASRLHLWIVPLVHRDLEFAAYIGLIAIKRMRSDFYQLWFDELISSQSSLICPKRNESRKANLAAKGDI